MQPQRCRLHALFASARPLRALAAPLLTAFALTGASLLPAHSQPGVHVLMQHNNLNRTGANLSETILHTGNVNANTFGKLFARPVDGQIYAQPLYVSHLDMPDGSTHNVVFVATMHNSLYAFDADDPNLSEPLWKISFIDPLNGIIPVPYQDLTGFPDIHPEVGTLSTPAIDLPNGTIYVVAKTRETTGGNTRYVQRLHAINLRTGAEKFGGPVELAAEVLGSGDGSYINDAGLRVVGYDARKENQRPGLVLNNGTLYIASASHGDNGPYHGWVLAYNPQTLVRIAAFNTTPNGGLGGIWQSGQAPVVDANGNLYFMTGNGSFSESARNYGDSFVKLDSGLNVVDYFTPYNQQFLSDVDADLGVSGPMLLPNGSDLLVGGSKEGRLYVVNRTNMGRYNPTRPGGAADDSQIRQWFWGFEGHLHGSPIYWKGPNNVELIYLWSEADVCKAYRFLPGLALPNGVGGFQTTPFATSAVRLPDGMPGAFLSLSANGSQAGTGILWANHPFTGNANWDTVPGILRAFDASTLQEIWNSLQNADRDDLGMLAKFCPPTIVNGKVYMATFSDQLVVYGLGQWVAKPVITPDGGDFPNSISVTITEATPGATLHYTLDGSEPTAASPLYTAALTLSDCAIVKAKAFKVGVSESPTATARFLINSPVGTGEGLKATYFDNLDFVGPSHTQIDPVVSFAWNGASPAFGIAGTDFSARWTGQVQPRCTGQYTFYTVADDGVRLWVNNQLLIDNWVYQGPTESAGVINLVKGQKYDIKMEYFQGGGGATAQLWWSSLMQTKQVIPQTQLYANARFVPAPVLLPNGASFTPTMSVHITDAMPDAAIHYTLDGVEPTEASPLYTGPITLNATTTVSAKAFKTGYDPSDMVSAVFTRFTPSAGGSGLTAQYYNDPGNGTRFGTLALTRTDSSVDFDWGVGSPGAGVGADNFSVRWTGQVQAPISGTYIFKTTSDDGVRLWVGNVNGNPGIDNWTDHGPTDNTFSINLVAGLKYNLKMEFYEAGGGALARLHWSYPGQPDQAIPASRLFSPVRTVSGTIGLENSVDLVQPLTFEFRPTDGSSVIVYTATLSEAGTFSLQGLPLNTFDVWIKGAKWLARVVSLDTRNGNVANLNASLRGGDANNDNSADALDLALLIEAFNTTFGVDASYNAAADLNGDSSVDALDLDILINNFNTEGAP